jgi:hypothetical protein
MTTTTKTPITHADRCDRCGAQARVRATFPIDPQRFGTFASGMVLLFCQHHYNDHEAKLAELVGITLEVSSEPLP